MKVAAFGLGRSGATTDIVTLNTATTSGYFEVGAADANRPGPGAGSVLVIRYGSNTLSQVAFGTVATRMWLRRSQDNGATWSTWLSIIPERGSNANGEYARFSDGTQICTVTNLNTGAITGAAGALYSTGLIGWSFPAAFITAPVVSGSAGNASGWVAAANAGLMSVGWKAFAPISVPGEFNTASLLATGRWY